MLSPGLRRNLFVSLTGAALVIGGVAVALLLLVGAELFPRSRAAKGGRQTRLTTQIAAPEQGIDAHPGRTTESELFLVTPWFL
jgi:hypothetical protein